MCQCKCICECGPVNTCFPTTGVFFTVKHKEGLGDPKHPMYADYIFECIISDNGVVTGKKVNNYVCPSTQNKYTFDRNNWDFTGVNPKVVDSVRPG